VPTQIEKLEGHASHLLDAFIGLREKFALLEPMLFNKETIQTRGSRGQARGFSILRHSLFLSCAQDIAKLCLDADARTPSICKIVEALDDLTLRKELEERYAIWVIPSAETETDPDIVAALKRMEEQERSERRIQFLEHVCELQRLWRVLQGSKSLDGFFTLRNKVSAHIEVRYVADKYQLVDIAELGIKWSDLRGTIDSMQHLVELIGLIVRNTCFAWDSLETQLTKAASGFWVAPSAG
jgi:hypothetical protein